MESILVVDDQEVICREFEAILSRESYDVVTTISPLAVFELIEQKIPDLVLCDLHMPEMDGVTLLRKLRESYPELPVIIITGHGSIDAAVNVMRHGAADFITKPVTAETILLTVERVLQSYALKKEVQYLRDELRDRYTFNNIVSKSPKMFKIFELIKMIANTDTTVMVSGETGTGKELISRAIHYNSNRREKRFVRINCGALTESLLESELFGHERGAFTGAIKKKEGLFEVANGGSLLLDEIGEMPESLQVKLLRVLEDYEFMRVGGTETIRVNVRVIAATNRDLRRDVAAGRFREDLFFRLNVIPIHVPPLRDRPEDIPLLIQKFIQTIAEKVGCEKPSIEPNVLHRLVSYRWPGNVRELENIVERLVITTRGSAITKSWLPEIFLEPEAKTVPSKFDIGKKLDKAREELVEQFEREYLHAVLRLYRGNLTQVAKHAGISRKTLYNKMQAYQLQKEEFKT